MITALNETEDRVKALEQDAMILSPNLLIGMNF